MKLLFTIIISAFLLPAFGQIKITELPAVTGSPNLTDVLPIVNNGVTRKVTVQQIKNTATVGYVAYTDTNTVIATRHDVDSLYNLSAKVITFTTTATNTYTSGSVAALSKLVGRTVSSVQLGASILKPTMRTWDNTSFIFANFINIAGGETVYIFYY